MLQGLSSFVPSSLIHHESMGNVSEGNISDNISESSDNATLLSLSREDLVALGAGSIREEIRVNRKKLETLIIRENQKMENSKVDEDGSLRERHYMDLLMDRTNTYIQWPSKMKIGAKTKKDLYIRVYGHNQDEVDEAKNQILADLGPHRDLRITLKMEISYTDHSHLIGCRGQTIRKVMDDTGCHIHFPDSNRMSKEHKSNQVTIAGSSIAAVEQARSRVRELSPLVFQISMPTLHSPYELHMNPDHQPVFIDNIQNTYGVQVTTHPPTKLQQTFVSVKGCEVEAAAVKEAVAKLFAYFSGTNQVGSVQVDSTMEISPVQHPFVRAVNDSNIHAIMMNTGARITFPDLSDGNMQQIKRSRVTISGDINAVYSARQQLIGCLPLRMIFDIADDFSLDWEAIRQFGSELNVNVKMINRNRVMERGGAGMSSLPPPVPGRSRTIQLIAHERNTTNMFEVRRRILGGIEPVFSASIPSNYLLRPSYPTSDMKAQVQYGNRLTTHISALPPLMLPSSPGMLSPVLSPSFWPPTPFSSPFLSPSMATFMNNGNSMGAGNCPPGFGNNNGMSNGREGRPPVGKLTLNLQPTLNYGYNATGLPSPSPINPHPPEINLNGLKQSFHLPLVDPLNFRMDSDSNLNTPMSLSGTSMLSDLSPMTMHPGVGMVNALINDFGNMDMHRKAPGCERSNTAPNLFANLQSDNSSNGVVNGSEENQQNGNGAASDGESRSGSPSVGDPTSSQDAKNCDKEQDESQNNQLPNVNDKKYMAVKAMYQTRIASDSAPRVPTSEWSGCGFSKTYLNLFPEKKVEGNKGGDNGLGGSEDKHDKFQGNSANSQTNGNNAKSDHNTNNVVQPKTHLPLGHQQSDFLDFTTTRYDQTIKPPSDLPSLFIENGLGKYVDSFVSEEIDLDTFSTLNENDLRALGVNAYHARKRMLVLITQLACPRQQEQWTRNN